MSPPSTDLRCRLRCRRGQAAVELAMVMPILLIILLGVIEFGRAFELKHAVNGLSREGANLAARGTSLQQAIAVTLSNGADISLDTLGGVVASRVLSSGGTVRIEDQEASAGYAGRSKIGIEGGQVSAIDVSGLSGGESFYVVEVFYDFSTVTPLSGLTRLVFPEELYERTVF
ncbi:MAG: pilus assembly protein [Proteobacteria bacterium]|nr:pilus assembly protein [Pseudomonadota bacterium]